MLLLKKHLVELVRAGRKRQTLRFWTHALVRAGQVTYVPGLGKIRVTALTQIASLAALTQADALADGFADLPALLAELRRIYGPGLPEGKKLFRVTFDWPVDEAGAEKPKPAKTKAKATQPRNPRRAKTRPGMTPAQREALRRHILAQAPS